MTQRNLFVVISLLLCSSPAYAQPELFPAPAATEVNPDTRLKLTFASTPALGNRGKIQIIDAADDTVADELDLSVPPGPRNNRSPAPYDTLHYDSIPDTVFTVSNPDTDASHVYQSNHVGGTEDSDARHFFPVLIDQNVATITPHNNRLSYGKTYYVQIEPEAFPLPDNSFQGIRGKSTWSFSTKRAAPALDAKTWVVSADNSGDFSSVQGALDATPDNSDTPKEIFIKNGTYDEIISFRNKQNLTLRGEDRRGVLVRYANNGVFNRTGRYAFAISGSTAINLINFTIQSVGKDENPAQAEALFARADKLQVHHVTMLGSGDALQIQTNTRMFLSRSSVRGYGDNLLSYGAAFFRSCDLISTYGPHGWPRNPQTNHGDVFVDSSFSLEGEGTSGDGHCTLARSPASSSTNGVTFPYAEFVLINCKLSGIAPEGWGDVGPDYANVHFWEYNSVNSSDGKPVDVSQRVPYSRQLTMENDAETIANYSDPSYVLAGWTPELPPLVLTQPAENVVLAADGTAELAIEVAAEPVATFQWRKNDQPLPNETSSALALSASTADVAADYTLVATNPLGTVTSGTIRVTVEGASQPTAAATQATAGTSSAPVAPAANATLPATTNPPAAINAQPAATSSSTASPARAAAAPDQQPQSSVKRSGGCNLSDAGATDAICSLLFVGLLSVFTRRRRCRAPARIAARIPKLSPVVNTPLNSRRCAMTWHAANGVHGERTTVEAHR